MKLRMWMLMLALAACSSASSPRGPTPSPATDDVPPATRDPGAVEDEPPLGPSVPPPGRGGGETAAGAQRGDRADGAACLASSECASGSCEGLGCTDDKPGVCAAKSRGCTRDLRQFCGCDGVTFGASGSCPGRRFSAKTACK